MMATDTKFSYYHSNKELGLNSYGVTLPDASGHQPTSKPMPLYRGGKIKNGSVYQLLKGGCLTRTGHYRMNLRVGAAGRVIVQLGDMCSQTFDGYKQHGQVFQVDFVYSGAPLYRPSAEIAGMISSDWFGSIVYLGPLGEAQ